MWKFDSTQIKVGQQHEMLTWFKLTADEEEEEEEDPSTTPGDVPK
jgi:hypothetical protein